MTIIQRSYRLLSPAFEQKIEYIAAVLIVHKTFSRQNGYTRFAQNSDDVLKTQSVLKPNWTSTGLT